MLDTRTIEIVKSTLPLLENAGVEVTDHFYKRMFSHNPELKDIFNLSNQPPADNSLLCSAPWRCMPGISMIWPR